MEARVTPRLLNHMKSQKPNLEPKEFARALQELFILLQPRDGVHKHRCRNCGTVWEHPNGACLDRWLCDRDDGSNVANKEAHSCPKCGTEQYLKHLGKDTATHRSTSCGAALPIESACCLTKKESGQ